MTREQLKYQIYAILIIGSILCSGCSKLDQLLLNPAGECTITLTNNFRLEKIDAENVYLLDASSRDALGGNVAGIAKRHAFIYFQYYKSKNELSYSVLDVSTNLLTHYENSGLMEKALAYKDKIVFQDIHQLLESGQLKEVGVNIYQFKGE